MKRHIRLVIMAASLGIILLTSCQPTVSPTVAPTEIQAPMPTEAPRVPKVVSFIQWQDFVSLAPALAFGSEHTALLQAYENLVYYNPPGSSQMLKPGLATRWETTEEGKEWTFYLREGVLFHDGTLFNAEAVKATIDYYLAAEGAGCSWIWDPVEEVEVVDDYTARLHLSYTAPMDLISAAAYCGGMISPAVVNQPQEWFDIGNSVGTGPYTIESFERGQRLIMTRFDDYWGGWQENQFDKIVYEIISDPVVALMMIEGGEVDIMTDPTLDKVNSLMAMEELNVSIQPSYTNVEFLLNTVKPPLNNKLVRQALAYSFPYDQLIERAEGLYTQAHVVIPYGMWGHCEDCFQFSYDLDKAKELLVEAGYPDGGFELMLTYAEDAIPEAWAVELWTFPLAELGIELNPQAMPFETMWELGIADPVKAQDIATFMWWPTWMTPYDFLYNMFHCEEEPYYNFAYWCNDEFDRLIDEANVLSAADRNTAEQMFHEAQEILMEEVPAIFLVDIPHIIIVRSDIEGYVNNPAYPGVPFIYPLTTTR